ncbi:hypothetical protein H0H93_006260, partial [Arthromyces matolae]
TPTADLTEQPITIPIPTTSEPTGPTHPDIGYYPDEKKWLDRTARRLRENPSLIDTELPPGFPKKLDSELVWEGKDWKSEEQWVYELNEEELKEIDSAVRHFR